MQNEECRMKNEKNCDACASQFFSLNKIIQRLQLLLREQLLLL